MTADSSSLSMETLVQPIDSVSIEALAHLKVDAYRGTTGWEDGDDESVAEAEIRAVISGEYGTFLPSASGVRLNSDGVPVAALFASMFEGQPTILFVYTRKANSGQGHATALIRNAARGTEAMGEPEISLFVSESNPALALYEKLGFRIKA